MTKISIILPVYNADSFIRTTIESLFSQTFNDFELIVINDGSTDNSLNIISNYKNDPRLKIINNDKNLGLIYTLNRGIKMAKGELIARIDADDIAIKNRLKLQADYMDNHPNVALVGGWAELIDEQGAGFHIHKVPTAPTEILNSILLTNCFIHPSVMFRRSIALELGGFRQEALHAEDYDLWLRMCEHHQVANLPNVLIQYRIHPGQISQQKLKMQRLSANKARFSAFKYYSTSGKIQNDIKKVEPSALQKLKAYPPSVGADYLNWIHIYHLMGRQDLVNSLILPAFKCAPLSKRIYFEIATAIKKNRLIKHTKNLIHWYKKRILNILRGINY